MSKSILFIVLFISFYSFSQKKGITIISQEKTVDYVAPKSVNFVFESNKEFKNYSKQFNKYLKKRNGFKNHKVTQVFRDEVLKNAWLYPKNIEKYLSENYQVTCFFKVKSFKKVLSNKSNSVLNIYNLEFTLIDNTDKKIINKADLEIVKLSPNPFSRTTAKIINALIFED